MIVLPIHYLFCLFYSLLACVMITFSNDGPFIKEYENKKLENEKVEVKVDKNEEKN